MEKDNKIYCDDCKSYLDSAENPEFDHSGVNAGEHECQSCKKEREKRYDNYVDPANMYRNQNRIATND